MLSNTSAIRAGAQHFAAVADGMKQKAIRVDENASTLSDRWKGSAADAFHSVSELLSADIETASTAFEQVSHALYTLASRLDQVNAYRQQIEQIGWQLQSLEQSQWGADEQRRSMVHGEIAHLSIQRSRLEYEADLLERQADAAASVAFGEIASLVNRLHFLQGMQATKANDSSLLHRVGDFFSGLWHKTEKAVEDAYDKFETDFKQEEAKVEQALDQFQARVEQGSWLGGTVGFVEGFAKSIYGLLEMATTTNPTSIIENAILHPDATLEKAKAIFNDVMHPVETSERLWETGKVIWSTVKKSFDEDIIHGNAYTRSEWAGYAAGTVLQAVLTDGAGLGADLAADGAAVTESTLEVTGRQIGIQYSLEQVKRLGPSFHESADQALEQFGTNREEFNSLRNLPLEQPGGLSADQISLIQNVRNSVQMDDFTVMQKVFPVKDIDKYLNGTYTEVRGYVARAQDTVHLETATDVKQELRLDYNSPKHKYSEHYNPDYPNPYLKEDGEFNDDPVVIMRFSAKKANSYETPFDFSVENVKKYYPFTGTGFLGGETIIPEYKLGSRMRIPDGAEIWMKSSDGQEILVAKYDNKQWVKLK